MPFIKKIFIVTTFLTFPLIVSASADGWSASSGTTVSQFRSFAGHIYMTGDDLTELLCVRSGLPNINTKNVRLSSGEPGFEEMFSILLAAKFSGKKVRFYREAECPGGAYRVSGVRLVD